MTGKAKKVLTPRSKRRVYESKIRSDKQRAALMKSLNVGDWADWRPRRDVGIYANERQTYTHNGEVK